MDSEKSVVTHNKKECPLANHSPPLTNLYRLNWGAPPNWLMDVSKQPTPFLCSQNVIIK